MSQTTNVSLQPPHANTTCVCIHQNTHVHPHTYRKKRKAETMGNKYTKKKVQSSSSKRNRNHNYNKILSQPSQKGMLFKKTKTTTCWNGHQQKGTFIYSWWECLCGSQYGCFQKPQNRCSFGPAICNPWVFTGKTSI